MNYHPSYFNFDGDCSAVNLTSISHLFDTVISFLGLYLITFELLEGVPRTLALLYSCDTFKLGHSLVLCNNSGLIVG